MKKFYMISSAFFIFILCSFNLQARVHNFETSRLKSTAGTGVASILMDEGTILNPASPAFFSVSSIYLQHNKTKYSEPDSRSYRPNFIPSSRPSYGIILSDGQGNLKGSLALIKQREIDDERKRLSLALASSIGSMSTMGISVSKSWDLNRHYTSLKEETYVQTNIGVIHAVDSSLSFGLVVFDVFRVQPEDSRFVLGTQYIIKRIVQLMFDFGSDYKDDLSKNILYRGAFQLNFLNDFYFRLGAFHDKKLEEKGSGIGLGWITPKFNLEVGYKTTKTDYSSEKAALKNYPPKKMQDISISISAKL